VIIENSVRVILESEIGFKLQIASIAVFIKLQFTCFA